MDVLAVTNLEFKVFLTSPIGDDRGGEGTAGAGWQGSPQGVSVHGLIEAMEGDAGMFPYSEEPDR